MERATTLSLGHADFDNFWMSMWFQLLRGAEGWEHCSHLFALLQFRRRRRRRRLASIGELARPRVARKDRLELQFLLFIISESWF
jgi:hypothetical protein